MSIRPANPIHRGDALPQRHAAASVPGCLGKVQAWSAGARCSANADLGELLLRAAGGETSHRRLALERAARAARFWPEEAVDVAEAGRSLTELASVGPWVGAKILGWFDDPPPVPDREPERVGYLTLAEVRRILAGDPSWEATPHGDLQVHSTDSDGSLALEDMMEAARLAGRTFVAATDHSRSLTIAHGQDEASLAAQGERIASVNARYARAGEDFRVLRSIEMDVFDDGSGDMANEALADLDLVLGAFHTKLRVTEDATERYLAALRNPTVHVLAHPQTRMYGRRVGLHADWPRVFDEAARAGARRHPRSAGPERCPRDSRERVGGPLVLDGHRRP